MGPLKILQVVWFREALVTLRASEWLLSCMGSLMLLQRTWSWKHLTLCALEWILSSVWFHVLSSNLMFRSSCDTLCTWMASLLCVGPLMFLQVPSYSLSGPILRSSCQILSISKASLLCGSSNAPSRTWSWKTLVTLCAHEWLLSCVGPLMFL